MAATVATDALHPRRARLEYWFLKFNVPGFAFLADLIVGPDGGEVRLSYWRGLHGRVIHERPDITTVRGTTVRIGECTLGPDSSAGVAGEVEWRLRYEAGPRLVDPGRFTHRIRPFDMELLSVPGTQFHGEVFVGGERFAVDGAHGLLAHYWGDRLPPRWHWISVNTPDLDIDGAVIDSRVWGLPRVTLRAGYLYVAEHGRQRLVISPLTGLVRAKREGDALLMEAITPGRERLAARCTADQALFNDLGQGISQTLVGDCEIGGRRITGVAGIERRSTA